MWNEERLAERKKATKRCKTKGKSAPLVCLSADIISNEDKAANDRALDYLSSIYAGKVALLAVAATPGLVGATL